MKLRNAIVALLAGALAVTSMAAVAQNQNRGGDRAQQQVRERQVERATERDRTMQHERLQSRDRDRVHAQEPTGGGEGDRARQQDRDQDQVRDRDRIHQTDASSMKGGDIYGQNLMTEQERNRYREQLMRAGTPEEQEQLRARHREEMQKRAREQGVEIEEPEGE